jgi:hypothetical protein
LFGGIDPDGPELATVDAVDLSTGSWSQRAAMGFARVLPHAVLAGDWILLFGGRIRFDRGSSSLVPLEMYSWNNDCWTQAKTVSESSDHKHAIVLPCSVEVQPPKAIQDTTPTRNAPPIVQPSEKQKSGACENCVLS